jgi:cobalt-zinc-cadmium efflux system membrane fusion protein
MKVLMLLGLLIACIGCGEAAGQESKGSPEIAAKTVTVERPLKTEVRLSIDATGHAQADLKGLAKVVSPVAGLVEKILVGVGAQVKRGDPIAAINSADISDLYSSYLSNQAQAYQAERLFELNRELFEKGIVSKTDFLTAEGNYRQIQATLKGQEAKMHQYGVSRSDEFVNFLTIQAPIDGVVAEIYAHIGDRTDSTSSIALIANPEEMLVVADLHDVELTRLGPKGSEVSFSTDIQTEKVWKGILRYVGDVQDPDTKTVKVYIKPQETGIPFRQNMFFKIRILGEMRTLPAISKSALVYRDGKFYVYVRHGSEYPLKEVRPVHDTDATHVALEGITLEDEIVTSSMDQERP